MNRNQLLSSNGLIYRVLDIKENKALVIDCIKMRVPCWINTKDLDGFSEITQEDLLVINNVKMPSLEYLSLEEKKIAQSKYASIGSILPIVGNDINRNEMISYLSKTFSISKKTLVRRLCLFLVYQDICCFVIKHQKEPRELTKDEKNFRYILNKYFYTREKRTLRNCYLMLLREKYSNEQGILKEHPSLSQFKYFYYKNRKLDSMYISREGRSEYERNIRPLLSHSRDFFNTVGYGLADSTILDIYILDKQGKPRRPYLSAMVDGYSGLCLGFSIGFNGGEPLLKNLILNVNANKVDYCKELGIEIDEHDWMSKGLPNVIVTDNGKDYTSSYFTQLTDLGIQIQTNKTHLPTMKGGCERFFGIFQELIKPYLFRSGIVGKENYPEKPKDNAILTLEDLEKIMVKAIIFYNSKMICNLPYGKDYLKPYRNELFIDSYNTYPNSFICASNELIELIMLPRTKGIFTRFGLKVGKLAYRAYGFVNEFLEPKREEVVAYYPNDVSRVWLIRDKYYEFTIIDKYFEGKSIADVIEAKQSHSLTKKNYVDESINSEIQLGKDIEEIINKRGIKK